MESEPEWLEEWCLESVSDLTSEDDLTESEGESTDDEGEELPALSSSRAFLTASSAR